MKVLKSQRELFNKIIELVHGLTLAVHTDNREEFEHCIKELKKCLK